MGIKFIVKQTQQIQPVESQVFNDSYWSASVGSWNEGAWNGVDGGESGYSMTLDAINAWYEGYRPTSVSITGVAGDAGSISLNDSDENTIASGTATTGTIILPITFAGFDIENFVLNGYSSITDITFTGPGSGSGALGTLWYNVAGTYASSPNDFWEPHSVSAGEGFEDDAIWNTNVWSPNPAASTGSISLRVLTGTTWAEDFRPTAMRIIHDGDNSGADVADNIILREDPDGGFVISTTPWKNYVSGTPIPLTFETGGEGANDLISLSIPRLDISETSFNVSGIEFSGDVPGGGGVPETWYPAFNTSYWTGDGVFAPTWDGTKWSRGTSNIQMIAIGGWQDFFRPTKIRITGTMWDTQSASVREEGGQTIGTSGSPIGPSPVVIDLSFDSGAAADDIHYLTASPFSTITNIEFDVEPVFS